MTTGQKMVIVVLTVIVCLFVGLLFLQGSTGDGDASQASSEESLLKDFADRFARTSDANRDELSSSCFQPNDTLVVVNGCELFVGPSDSRLRLVRLHALEGQTTVSAPGPEDANATITKTLGGDDKVAIAVDRTGSTIELFCPGIFPCALQLVTE